MFKPNVSCNQFSAGSRPLLTAVRVGYPSQVLVKEACPLALPEILAVAILPLVCTFWILSLVPLQEGSFQEEGITVAFPHLVYYYIAFNYPSV